MKLINQFPQGRIFWRLFSALDTSYIAGITEGILAPGAEVTRDAHTGSFKIECKHENTAGAFVVHAGPLFNNSDTLVLDDHGGLSVLAPVPAPAPVPQPSDARPKLPQHGPTALLRVMTWNIMEGPRIPRVAELIKEQRPDIVLLNEAMIWRFGPTAGNQIEDLARLLGFPYNQFCECVWMGLAGIKIVGVLSRYPLGQFSRLPTFVNGAYIGYATLKTSISVAGKTHHIYSTRFDAHNAQNNMQSAQIAADSIHSLPSSDPVIFGGDMNAQADGGGTNGASFTFFSAGSGLAHVAGPGIDHIFFRGPYVARGTNIDPPDNPSDHGFVIADLQVDFTAAFGSVVKIAHDATRRRLHSHPLNYSHPHSSGQQQITGFGGADENDWWLIRGPDSSAADFRLGEPVRHGDIIRFEHVQTQRNLHSHNGFPSPISGQHEVTGFGTVGVGDDNDNWRLDVENGGDWKAGGRVRLIHLNTGRALHSHDGCKSRSDNPSLKRPICLTAPEQNCGS